MRKLCFTLLCLLFLVFCKKREIQEPIIPKGIKRLDNTFLSEPRAKLAATAWGNKVFFAGGRNNIAYSGRVDIFDLETNVWSTASLSIDRSLPVGIAANGKVFFAGGYRYEPSKRIDIFDIATNTWSIDSLSEPKSSLVAAAANGKVFFAGGVIKEIPFTLSDKVDIFDANTGKYITTETLSERKYYEESQNAASLGGKIFFASGTTITGPSDLVEIFDANTGKRINIAHLSQARYDVASAAWGNKVFFAGGNTKPGGPFTNRVDIYDISTNKWDTASLSENRNSLVGVAMDGAIVFAGTALNGKMFFGGGDTTIINRYTNLVEIFTTTR